MRIVFMGTPDFAVPSLERLVADGHEIAAVFTQPDKPRSRMKRIPSPVKAAALEHGFTVFQPTTVRDEAVLQQVRELHPQLLVVVAYGKILPQALLDIPTVAAINVHSSILPRYRGAAPINWAILQGDTETGVTVQHLGAELDAGDIILVKKTPISPEEDAGELTRRLSFLGAEALGEAVAALANGTARRIPQGEAVGPYAAMLSREMSPIDWNKPAQSIVNQIRGLIPWPCASMELQGNRLKVYQGRVGEATSAQPGSLIFADKRGIAISAGDGRSVVITQLQPEGGKRMSADAYLLGHPVQV